MFPLRDCSNINTITVQGLRPTVFQDFCQALDLVKATVSDKDLDCYL